MGGKHGERERNRSKTWEPETEEEEREGKHWERKIQDMRGINAEK